MMKTNDELIACVEREIKLRHCVYSTRVGIGKMRPARAAHEIECMEQILELLRRSSPPPPQQDFPSMTLGD